MHWIVAMALGLLASQTVSFEAAAQATKAGEKLLQATLGEKIGGETKTKFSTDTAKISAFWKGETLKAGDKLRAVWIAEGQGGLKDATITEGSVIAYKPDDDGIFSLVSPKGGWPVGKYRVEIYVGPKLAETLKFTIEPGVTVDIR
jgi:hypothetical protein